ncbi:CBS domain-containing protein [Candidatus Pyrohabitans sp.]
MKTEQLMTPEVVTIDKDRKLSDALGIMEKHRISRLVVVNEGKIVGIVTDKDILEVMGSSKYANKLPSSLHVSTAMSRGVITVGKDADVSEAARLMLSHRIKSLPVVNDGELVGIVTTTDLLKPLQDSEEKVEKVMTRRVITISPEDRAIHARRLMLDNGISRLVVIEEGNIVGILTERQLGRALGAFKSAADSKQVNRVRNMIVEDVMTQAVVTLSSDSTVGETSKLMLERGFSGIPIVDAGDNLAGIVTKTDLMKLLV